MKQKHNTWCFRPGLHAASFCIKRITLVAVQAFFYVTTAFVCPWVCKRLKTSCAVKSFNNAIGRAEQSARKRGDVMAHFAPCALRFQSNSHSQVELRWRITKLCLIVWGRCAAALMWSAKTRCCHHALPTFSAHLHHRGLVGCGHCSAVKRPTVQEHRVSSCPGVFLCYVITLLTSWLTPDLKALGCLCNCEKPVFSGCCLDMALEQNSTSRETTAIPSRTKREKSQDYRVDIVDIPEATVYSSVWLRALEPM